MEKPYILGNTGYACPYLQEATNVTKTHICIPDKMFNKPNFEWHMDWLNHLPPLNLRRCQAFMVRRSIKVWASTKKWVSPPYKSERKSLLFSWTPLCNKRVNPKRYVSSGSYELWWAMKLIKGNRNEWLTKRIPLISVKFHQNFTFYCYKELKKTRKNNIIDTR